MAEIDEMREDGELSDEGEDTEIYQKVERPQLSINNTRNNTIEPYKSESSDDNSDSDGGVKRIIKRLDKPQTSSMSGVKSKNGHLWKSMIQEETLMETMKTIDVSRKRKNDRGAESYDFPGSNETKSDEEKRKWKKRRLEHSGNESSSSNASSSRSKRRRKNQNRNRKYMPVSRILPPIESSVDGLECEEFINELADNLEEQNLELIRRVVTVIGKAASLEIYKTTQDVEREGGMLTMNRIRRRTPGGVFLFLLKESSFIDEESRKMIFSNDKKPAERKMSSEQMSKIPPNSPENSDYVENEQRKSTTLTDPDLLSQKILNYTNDVGDNDDMDIF